MRVLISDDEALARSRLRRMVEAIEGHTCVGEAADAAATLEACAALQPDVVLLDIQMPGCNGLEVAHALRNGPRPPAVVFVTAHAEHAVQAFDVAAAHYLLKPVRLDQLAEALARVHPSPPAETPTHLRARLRGRVELVPVDGVRYFEADHKYVTAHTGARSFLLEDSLSALGQQLGHGFVRVHRKLLVNRAWIACTQRDGNGRLWLELKDGTRLEVSRRCAPTLRRALAATVRLGALEPVDVGGA